MRGGVAPIATVRVRNSVSARRFHLPVAPAAWRLKALNDGGRLSANGTGDIDNIVNRCGRVPGVHS